MMKKKLFALAMAGSMVLNVPISAIAEETGEPLVFDYSMIDEEVYDGTWLTALGTIDLFLPDEWKVLVYADAEDAPEDNIYLHCTSEDGTRSVMFSYFIDEGITLDSLAEELEQEGYDDVLPVTINDIRAITYSSNEDGVTVTGIMAVDDEGGCYNLVLSAGETDDDFMPFAQNIVYSFSLTES